jgi:hypothetical protein
MIDIELLDRLRRALIHLLNAIDDVLIAKGKISVRTIQPKAERRAERRKAEFDG